MTVQLHVLQTLRHDLFVGHEINFEHHDKFKKRKEHRTYESATHMVKLTAS